MPATHYYEKRYGITLNGRRLLLSSEEVNDVYKKTHKKVVEVRYVGPTKAICKGCGRVFLYDATDRGRQPEFHSDACKQKAYRERKKRASK